MYKFLLTVLGSVAVIANALAVGGNKAADSFSSALPGKPAVVANGTNGLAGSQISQDARLSTDLSSVATPPSPATSMATASDGAKARYNQQLFSAGMTAAEEADLSALSPLALLAPTPNSPFGQKPATRVSHQELEGALIGVLGIENLVMQTEAMCIRTEPSAQKKYSDSANGWKLRNAVTVDLAHQLFSEVFAPAKRQGIESIIHSKNELDMAIIEDSPMPHRIQWCNKSAAKMKDGEIDVYNNSSLTTPLKKYRGNI